MVYEIQSKWVVRKTIEPGEIKVVNKIGLSGFALGSGGLSKA